jgi:RNA polymerase sigma-70 factor (ECF subfamily)
VATPQTDEALLAAALGGANADFGSIVERHQGAVRSFLRRLTGNHAEADDLAQETFIAAWAQLGRFRGESSLRAWLCGIAYAKARDASRSGGRRLSREAASAPDEPAGCDAGLKLDLNRALQTLAVDERAAVALCLGGGFSHGEAAEALGIPLGTIKSHVQRGRAKLMTLLGDGDG